MVCKLLVRAFHVMVRPFAWQGDARFLVECGYSQKRLYEPMRYPTIAMLLCIVCTPLMASTNLTYQGRLDASGTPFDGTVPMQFQLHESETGDDPVGPLLDRSAVEVKDGLFQVDLDFGNVFDGPRWLQITVDGSPLDSRQRVAPTPTAIRADTLDGLDSRAFQRAFERTIVVSPVGSASANGSALLNAVGDITGASASNPFLVVIEPGTYSLDQVLVVPSNVHLRGAGQDVTRITRTGNIDLFSFEAVKLSSSTSLKELSVLAFGGGSGRIRAIQFNQSGEARIHRVTARAQGGDDNNYAVEARYSDSGDSLLVIAEATLEGDGGTQSAAASAPFDTAFDIRDSTLIATGAGTGSGGLRARGAASRLVDSQVSSDGTGVMSDDGNLVVRNCEIFGQNTGASGNLAIFDSRVEGIDNRALTAAGGSTTTAASTQLIGDVVGAGCVATYDGNLSFLAEGCP